MELLQNIDGGTAALVLVALCALCIVGPFLLSGLHFIGAILGIFGDVLGFGFDIISGGPAQWCGCLVVIGGCGFVALLVWLVGSALSTCDVNPTNFCALFGR